MSKNAEISAPRLLLSAKEYFIAAFSLKNEAKGEKILFPKNLLYCLSIELALKAFLRAKGVSANILKEEYGHDLLEILKEAGNKGLIISNYPELSVFSECYNLVYKTKGMEYVNTGYYSFKENYDTLEAEIKALITEIYVPCYESIGTASDIAQWHSQNTLWRNGEEE